MKKKRRLSEHFEKSLLILNAFYEHSSIAEHGVVKGMAREGFITHFLKDNLPSSIDYSSGQIIDKNDNMSGQIDILLTTSTAPKINLFGDIILAFNDFTLCAIEVKSNLQTSNLNKALRSFAKVKALKRDLIFSAEMGKNNQLVELRKTPCFLIAYEGLKMETLKKKLLDYGKQNHLKNEDYLPEITVVLKNKYYIYRDDHWLFNPSDIPELRDGIFINYPAPNKKDKGKENENNGSECLVALYWHIFKLITCYFRPDKLKGTPAMGEYF